MQRLKVTTLIPSNQAELTVNADCVRYNSSTERSFQQLSAIVPNDNELTFRNSFAVSSNIQIDVYLDKQTVTKSSFLVAFFTRTCHVIFMKTIAYVTVNLNKRHELFDLLLSTSTFGDSTADRKQKFGMTISNYNR